ncbi:MAG: ribose-5-phosphate isomerase RpiA [Phycisphaeraceae bacterium]|nr:ribose-5-phosphate isomerase RpiA [Phycisphaeraceae bacterium]
MTTTDTLAEMAVAPVRSGMVVGLGTGRAASRGIRALAARAQREGLSIECVATSEASAELARALGLKVIEFAGVERVDYLFDGADEITDDLTMLKGRGGAMTREKLVANASVQRVYLIDESKRVKRIGERFPLPIEVMPFALASVRARLRAIGLDGPVRARDDGSEYRTDNACVVIDAPVGGTIHMRALNDALARIDGVIGHGLFLSEADEALVESADGSRVDRMTRRR